MCEHRGDLFSRSDWHACLFSLKESRTRSSGSSSSDPEGMVLLSFLVDVGSFFQADETMIPPG